MKYSLLSLAVFFIAGCMSVSTFQTGKTLDRGEMEFGVSGALGEAVSKDPTIQWLYDTDELGILALESWARYGITDEIDAGGKFSFPASYTIDARYGIMNEEKEPEDVYYPFSTAVGFGYTSGGKYKETTIIDGDTTIKYLYPTDIFASVYLSKNLVRGWFVPYVTPKFVFRMIKGEKIEDSGESEKKSSSGLMTGATLGAAFPFRKARFMLEYTLLYRLGKYITYQSQFGLGIGVKF